jgi:hypothetical protein
MAQKNSAVASSTVARAPEGFHRVGSVTDAKWFAAVVGNVLHGVLENVYTRKDTNSKTGESKFFQLQLLAPCKASDGRGEDRKVVDVEADSYINLNYGPKTSNLESLIPDILAGAKYEVYAVITGPKMDIGGGKKMWPLDVSVKKVRAATDLSGQVDFEDGEDSAGSI